MKTEIIITMLAAASWSASAATTLTVGHVDVGIGYDSTSGWNLHVHDEESDAEFAPSDAILHVGVAGAVTVPSASAYSFLGAPGSTVWMLPQNENPSLIFLGLGTEEIEAGIFQNDSITFSLRAVTGPGHFSLYQVDSFGNPSIFMNSRDGITPADSYTAPVGSHGHFNWAFTEPGSYQVAFEASGILSGGAPAASGPQVYTFDVQPIPEPATLAIVAIGVTALLLFRRRAATPAQTHDA